MLLKKENGGQVTLQSPCASYMVSSVLVGHFMMLTIIFGPTFDIHLSIGKAAIWLPNISIFLVNTIEKFGKQMAALPIVIHG